MRRRDWLGLALVLGAAVGLVALRTWLIEPQAWDIACRGAAAWPIACLPRGALLWLQDREVWGGAALAFGLWALLSGRFAACVAGVVCGIGGAVNYNVTWGVLGAALAGWAWLRPDRPPAAGRVSAAPRGGR